MEQLDLFEDGPQPIQRYLHVWSEKERAHRLNKKTPDRPPGNAMVGNIQAASFSTGIADSSGQTSRQLVRKC